MRRVLAVGLVGLFGATAAQASWVYQGEASAFSGAGSHIVMTMNGAGYAGGFRCDDDGAKFVYITPEKITLSDLAGKILAGTLLVRVDDEPAMQADAVPDSTNDHLRLTGQFGTEILTQVRDAKRRVAVALKVNDKILHETSFPARGSTDAMRKFINACPAAEDARG